MTKAELVSAVAEKVKMTKNDVESTLDALLLTIGETLKDRQEIRLVGFGIFGTRDRKATVARNPKTGEPVQVPASVVPVFKSGKSLKEIVNK